MNKNELDICFHRAHSQVENSTEKAGACDGIAFWEKKKEVTVEQAAAFMRWQALQLNGEWDAEALREARGYLRNKAELMKGGPGWELVWVPQAQEAV
jgi:hypothetical protein